MGISCSCSDEYDWYYEAHHDFSVLDTKRPRRCYSCGATLTPGTEVLGLRCWHSPRNDVEERIHGDEVPMASRYLCEPCGGLYMALSDLGFCISMPSNLRDDVAAYNELREELVRQNRAKGLADITVERMR